MKARIVTQKVQNGKRPDAANLPPGKDSRESSWIPLLTVLFLTLFVYSPVYQFQFSTVDDGSNVYLNPYLMYPAAQNLSYFWTHTYYELYMPITDCLWALCARIAPLSTPLPLPLDHTTSSLNPAVFHALNLIFHGCNAGLVFAILRRLGFRAWPCAAGALLFALHPTQVESVAWITGFNNVLSGFFCFAALYLYLRTIPVQTYGPFAKETQPYPASSSVVRYRALFLLLATLCFLCALLSKPTATVLPLFIVIFEAVAFRRPLRQWIGVVVMWCAFALFGVAVTRFATNADMPIFWSPIWGRPFVAGDALGFYLIKLFFPIHLTFDYNRPPYVVLHAWWGYVDWLLPATIAVFLWIMGRRIERSQGRTVVWLWLRVAFLLFIAGFVSVLGFVPFYSQPKTTVSDRYLYLAMLGPAMALTALVSRASVRFSRAVGLAIGAVLVALLSQTVQQEYVWANSYSLTMNMLKESPNSAMTQHLFGNALSFQGNYAEALPHLLLAKRLQYKEVAATDHDLAYTLFHLGRYAEALSPLKTAVTLEPDRDDDWEMLWFALSHVQDMNSIESFLQNRVHANPRDGRAEFTLGVIQMQRRNMVAALPMFEAGARDAPGFADLQYKFGEVLERQRRYPEAEAQYQRALPADPENTSATSALAALRQRMGK